MLKGVSNMGLGPYGLTNCHQKCGMEAAPAREKLLHLLVSCNDGLGCENGDPWSNHVVLVASGWGSDRDRGESANNAHGHSRRESASSPTRPVGSTYRAGLALAYW